MLIWWFVIYPTSWESSSLLTKNFGHPQRGGKVQGGVFPFLNSFFAQKLWIRDCDRNHVTNKSRRSHSSSPAWSCPSCFLCRLPLWLSSPLRKEMWRPCRLVSLTNYSKSYDSQTSNCSRSKAQTHVVSDQIRKRRPTVDALHRHSGRWHQIRLIPRPWSTFRLSSCVLLLGRQGNVLKHYTVGAGQVIKG